MERHYTAILNNNHIEIIDSDIKYRIKENADEQYKYNVQILTKWGNGDFYYCGSGRFCKTLEDACAFIERNMIERIRVKK